MPAPKVRVVTKTVDVERQGPPVYVDKPSTGQGPIIKTRTCTTTNTVDTSLVCSPKRLCRAIASCTEAVFRLEVCAHTFLDGRKPNGIPCEAICGATKEAMQATLAREASQGVSAPVPVSVGNSVTTCTAPA